MLLSPKRAYQFILEHQKNNPEQMVRWLESQGEFTHLQKIAASDGELKLPPVPVWKRPFEFVKNQLWTQEDTLYGRSYTTDNVICEAKKTATTLSAANLINILTAYPYLYFVFVDLGGIGIALSVIMGGLLNKTANTFGESACRSQQKGEAKAGLAGFILLNLVFTLTAPPGIELLLDPGGLAERRGEELVREKVLATPLQDRELAQRRERVEETKAACQTILDQLNALPEDAPNRDLLYQQAHGTWGERNRNWSQVPIENLPVCQKATRLEEESVEYAGTIQALKEVREREVREYGSPLLYFRAVRPDIYRANFDADGQLISGLEASRLALHSFIEKLVAGDVSHLGFPLFFFVLSLITSGVSVARIFYYSRQHEVVRSWNTDIYDIREELFNAIVRGIHQISEAESQKNASSTSSNGETPNERGFLENAPNSNRTSQ